MVGSIPTRFASVDGFWNLCGPGSPIPIEVQGRHAAPTETDTLETVPVSDRKSVQTFPVHNREVGGSIPPRPIYDGR